MAAQSLQKATQNTVGLKYITNTHREWVPGLPIERITTRKNISGVAASPEPSADARNHLCFLRLTHLLAHLLVLPGTRTRGWHKWVKGVWQPFKAGNHFQSISWRRTRRQGAWWSVPVRLTLFLGVSGSTAASRRHGLLVNMPVVAAYHQVSAAAIASK